MTIKVGNNNVDLSRDGSRLVFLTERAGNKYGGYIECEKEEISATILATFKDIDQN